MALGIPKEKLKKIKPADPLVKDAAIKKKIEKLSNAIKIPAPINLFRTRLEGCDLDRLLALLAKYTPETKDERVARLNSSNPREGPKPILLKFGLRHVTDLVVQNRVKFLVIAADVAPITLVISLPLLCKKFGIPYAIVPHKAVLGGLVHLKTNAVIALEAVRPEDAGEFSEVVRISNAMFLDQHEKHMSTAGGLVMSKGQ